VLWFYFADPTVEGSSLNVGHINPHPHATRRNKPGPYRYLIRGDMLVVLFGMILPRFMGKLFLGIVAMCKPEGACKRARLVVQILGSIDTPSLRLSIIAQDEQRNRGAKASGSAVAEASVALERY
jgi:hypothetical protein